MLGFSLSPGGLLLPYHLGALASLSYHGRLNEHNPLAGSSAGAIAVAAYASQVPVAVALEASIRISSQCNSFYIASGQLMPSLWNALDTLLAPDAHCRVNGRPGMVGLAHREIFPSNRAILETHFTTRNHLMEAVCNSSMFPFFTSNEPFRMVRGAALPRIVVDGVFTEPWWRFGCPDLQRPQAPGRAGIVAEVDRSICISVFPQELVGLSYTMDRRNVICPELQQHNVIPQVARLTRLATTASDRKDLIRLYEEGWMDGERWALQEEAAISRNHDKSKIRSRFKGRKEGNVGMGKRNIKQIGYS